MKTRPNNKIVMHWIIVTPIIGLLLTFIKINTIGFTILIGLLFLTLVLNRTTYINVKNDFLLITKNHFLFFPTFRFSINLNLIENITIMDAGADIPGTDSVSDFDTALLIDLLTGIYFYKPRFKVSILSKQKKLTEIEINTSKSDLLKIKAAIKPTLKDRLIS